VGSGVVSADVDCGMATVDCGMAIGAVKCDVFFGCGFSSPVGLRGDDARRFARRGVLPCEAIADVGGVGEEERGDERGRREEKGEKEKKADAKHACVLVA